MFLEGKTSGTFRSIE